MGVQALGASQQRSLAKDEERTSFLSKCSVQERWDELRGTKYLTLRQLLATQCAPGVAANISCNHVSDRYLWPNRGLLSQLSAVDTCNGAVVTCTRAESGGNNTCTFCCSGSSKMAKMGPD